MKRKMLAVLCVVCVVVVSAGALSTNNGPAQRWQGHSGRPTVPSGATTNAAPLGTKQSPHPAKAPEYVIYRQVFRHLTALKEKSKELERQGKDGKKLRSHYQDQARLSNEQSRLLDEIAADCEREVAQQDAQAQKIIDAFRARFPNGVVPPGEKLPPPPPELRRMQRQRHNLIMRARQRLRAALGERGFQQLDDFIKVDVAPKVKPAQQVHTRASASSSPAAGQ